MIRASATLPMNALSVISSFRFEAGSPVSRRMASTSAARSPSTNWRLDTLTHITADVPPSNRRSHRAIWTHASRRIVRPIGTIIPVSSATRMKCSGLSRPRAWWRQRTSASNPAMRPESSDTIGW